MNRTLLTTAICATLMMAGTGYAQDTATTNSDTTTQDQTKPKKKDDAKNLDAVTVTGSLIPQSEKETVTPTITITAQELQERGYRNVYDALKTQTVSTGSTQDNQTATSGSFTPGAQTISLFGLDPGFTLILLNGHPMADYPLPYNGGQNITDLSTIPTEMVDHIDIATGGASSVYGSSAIAGVVNIVLKKQMDGVNLDVRGGGYHDGGGFNERTQISGGNEWGNLRVTYALDLENQNPISMNQSFFPSRLANPLGAVPGRDFLIAEPFTDAYVDPGAANCALSNGLFGGTESYSNRPGHGYYCGSYYDDSTGSILNQSKSANGYLNLNYDINSNVTFYTEILYSLSKQTINSGPAFWSYSNPALNQSANNFSGIFWDNATNDYESIQRELAPEEIGGVNANADNILTRQFNVNVGVKGGLGSSTWDYDLYYNRSQVNTDESQLWPLTQPFNQYYLGTSTGSDPYGYGFPAYTPNLKNFYTPLTPAQFDAMTAAIHSQSVSWEENLHITLTNTKLFELPAGPVGFAAIAETGDQAFDSPVDPRLIAGDFNNRTGTQGSGSRDRDAIGGELRIPITSMLTADASARWDSYSYAGRTDAKPTYKVGLEFRPLKTLLFRANYATAFRAPDMYYIFQGNSGFYDTATDYYECRLQGYTAANLSNCNQANEGIFSLYKGNEGLKDITAATYGLGTVWSPTDNVDFKLDYTHIAIDNEVETQDPNQLLELEADCRFGVSLGGQPYNINSQQCQDALAQVVRYPANFPFVLAQNQLQYITTFPINVANEVLSGIQTSGTWRTDLGRFGKLTFEGDYYVELDHKLRMDPTDPYIDLLHDFNSAIYGNSEFKTRTSGSVSWAIGKWTNTILGTLYGKAANFAADGNTGRWASFNGSTQYDLGNKSNITLSVNNLANRKPPVDTTFAPGNQYAPPYYNVYQYNGYGIAYWLEYNAHF